MSVYVIVQLNVHDRERYDKYSAALLPILAQFGGSVVVADDAPRVIEGEWTGNRVVVLRFLTVTPSEPGAPRPSTRRSCPTATPGRTPWRPSCAVWTK